MAYHLPDFINYTSCPCLLDVIMEDGTKRRCSSARMSFSLLLPEYRPVVLSKTAFNDDGCWSSICRPLDGLLNWIDQVQDAACA
jgi:hypothetical protein